MDMRGGPPSIEDLAIVQRSGDPHDPQAYPLARQQLANACEAADHAVRPAMRCVEVPKALPPGWWSRPFPAGSTVRWREQVAQKRAHLRATGKLKHDPDRRMQKKVRRLWGSNWQFIASGEIDGELRWMQVVH